MIARGRRLGLSFGVAAIGSTLLFPAAAFASTTVPNIPDSCGSGNYTAYVSTPDDIRYFCGLDTGANLDGKDVSSVVDRSSYQFLVFTGANRTGTVHCYQNYSGSPYPPYPVGAPT